MEKKSKKNTAEKSPEAAAAQLTASKILAVKKTTKVTAPKKSLKVAPAKAASPELKKKVKKAQKN